MLRLTLVRSLFALAAAGVLGLAAFAGGPTQATAAGCCCGDHCKCTECGCADGSCKGCGCDSGTCTDCKCGSDCCGSTCCSK